MPAAPHTRTAERTPRSANQQCRSRMFRILHELFQVFLAGAQKIRTQNQILQGIAGQGHLRSNQDVCLARAAIRFLNALPISPYVSDRGVERSQHDRSLRRQNLTFLLHACARKRADTLYHRVQAVGTTGTEMLLQSQTTQNLQRIHKQNLTGGSSGKNTQQNGDQSAYDVGVAVCNDPQRSGGLRKANIQTCERQTSRLATHSPKPCFVESARDRASVRACVPDR